MPRTHILLCQLFSKLRLHTWLKDKVSQSWLDKGPGIPSAPCSSAQSCRSSEERFLLQLRDAGKDVLFSSGESSPGQYYVPCVCCWLTFCQNPWPLPVTLVTTQPATMVTEVSLSLLVILTYMTLTPFTLTVVCLCLCGDSAKNSHPKYSFLVPPDLPENRIINFR